jgi:hypothetical protein
MNRANKRNSTDNGESVATKKVKVEAMPDKTEKRLPLKNLTAKAQSSFKSPLLSRNGAQVLANRQPTADTAGSIRDIENQINEMNKEIESFEGEGVVLDELDSIIDKLHIYNEIKDIAQIVMGKIAELKGVTIKKVHQDYDADFNDSY